MMALPPLSASLDRTGVLAPFATSDSERAQRAIAMAEGAPSVTGGADPMGTIRAVPDIGTPGTLAHEGGGVVRKASDASLEQYLSHVHETPPISLARGLPTGPAGFSNNVAWLAFASWNGGFYVAAPPSSVDFIPAGGVSATSIIPAGSNPFAVAVDPFTEDVFVTNSGSANVSVIDGSTQAVLTNIPVQKNPEGIALDASNRTVFVADNGTNNVSVISIRSLSVIATISVGSIPAGVAWDNATDRVFVTDRGSSEVTAINAATNRVLGQIPVGNRPFGIADDNTTGELYVANTGTYNVSIISARSETVTGTVPIAADSYYPRLEDVAYDNALHKIWVTAGLTVVVIDPSNNTAVGEATFDPSGAAFDPENGEMCVTNSANVTFGCFYYGPRFTNDANVTFTENGLPAGARWNVSLAGLVVVNQLSNTTSIRFGVDTQVTSYGFGSYRYSYGVSAAGGYSANPTVGNVSGTSSLPTSVSIAFTTSGSYLVTFAESGLPQGSPWSVTLGGDRISGTGGLPVRFAEPNGTLPYSIVGPSGYSATPSSGNLAVQGAARTTSITFTLTTYPVTFLESGLPGGTSWLVDLGSAAASSTSDQVAFSVPNGSYFYQIPSEGAFSASPGSGTVTVLGAPSTIDIRFAGPPSYPVTFRASGLTGYHSWVVNLSGNWRGSSGAPILFTEPNGTAYRYTAWVLGSSCYPPISGSFDVFGTWVNITVPFVQGSCTSTPCFSATFEALGLPAGANWSVNLTDGSDSLTGWSRLLSLTFSCLTWLQPAFRVTPPVGYSVSPPQGALDLSTGNVSIVLTFTPTTPLEVNASYSVLGGSPCGSNPGPITVSFNAIVSGGAPPYQYSWNFEDGSSLSNQSAPVHTYYSSALGGAPLAILTVTDAAAHTAGWVAPPLATACPSIPAPFFDGGGAFLVIALVLMGGLLIVVAVVVAVVLSQRTPPRYPPPY